MYGAFPYGTVPYAGFTSSDDAVEQQLSGTAIVWTVPARKRTSGILRKFAAEVRLFAFNFGLVPEMADGDTLVTATITQQLVSGSGALTIGVPDVNGDQVEFALSAGIAWSLYRVTCTVTTSTGRTLVAVGHLQVY